MKYIYNKKMQFLWISLIAYIYLFSCRLWFENEYVSVIIKIPMVFLVFVDMIILWYRRKELLQISRYYICRNKALFISIGLYVLYDVCTLFYADNISYSISKYRVFLRVLFVAGSIFLCCYEEKPEKMKENTEYLIKSIGWISIIFVITTIIRWSLGLSPYLNRVSLRPDYNVYSIYFIFTLIIYIFNYIKWEDQFSRFQKIVYIIFGIAACDLLLLTSSRRAYFLCLFIEPVSFLFYLLKKRSVRKRNCEERKKSNLWNLKSIVMILSFTGILIANFTLSVPLFDEYVESASEEKKNAHIAFFEKFVDGDLSSAGYSEEGLLDASLSERYSKSVERGFTARSMIWNITVSAIKGFNAKEVIFGRGSGYSWSLYEDQNNEEVMDLLEGYYHKKELKPQWMHPHNFFFTEFLEGGAIKILLILVMAVIICIYLWQYTKDHVEYGMMLWILYICLTANFMLGSASGLLGENLFWLTTELFALMRSTENMGRGYGQLNGESKNGTN